LQKRNYRLNNIVDNSPIFWEPAVIGSYGFDAIPGLRLETQIGFVSQINNTDVSFRKSNFSIGAIVNIREMLHRK
jgi:hypothetical protein